MPFSKIAHEAALAKVAAADATEVPDAIRAGFHYACQCLKLSAEQSARLGKFASIALEVAKPTSGLAKIAAEVAGGGADVNQESVNQSQDPGAVMYRLQLEAANKGVTVEQLAAQQRINLPALMEQLKATDAGKNDAGKNIDAKAKADAARVAAPGTQDRAVSGARSDAQVLEGQGQGYQAGAAGAAAGTPAPGARTLPGTRDAVQGLQANSTNSLWAKAQPPVTPAAKPPALPKPPPKSLGALGTGAATGTTAGAAAGAAAGAVGAAAGTPAAAPGKP